MQDREVTVEIPSGVDTGTRLRLSGRGEAGEPGGAPGDLYVEMHVEPDDRFERRGEELWHTVEVGLSEATLGKQIKVPLVGGGSHLLEIPPGTQPDSVFRISRQGMPRLQRRGQGDLVVHVDVRVPLSVSAEEEELLRRFAELRAEAPAPHSKRRRRRSG